MATELVLIANPTTVDVVVDGQTAKQHRVTALTVLNPTDLADFVAQGCVVAPGSMTDDIEESVLTAATGVLAITSLAVEPLLNAIASGATVDLTDPTNAHTQNWVTTAIAAAGATAIAVASQTPNFNYPVGSVVSIVSTTSVSKLDNPTTLVQKGASMLLGLVHPVLSAGADPFGIKGV